MRRPSLAAAIGAIVAATGLAAGVDPLSDNSLLTHLATGRLIVDGPGIPRIDPYSFTAAGEPWAVQSWFASTLYALAERVGGFELVRALVAVTACALAALGWRLTRPATGLVGRLAAVVPFLVVGFNGWGQRPLLLGLVFLALALLAADDGLDPRWLVPVGWMWLNVHGTWPLGLVALGALALGRRLDGERPATELRAAAWLVAGLVLGALNPYGPKLLAFPVTLLGRRENLEAIVEWQPPRFDSVSQLGFLLALAVAVVALRRRPSWRATLPLVTFTIAALLGARNVQIAALVLLPGIARGLEGVGEVGGRDRTPVSGVVALAAAALGAVVLSTTFTQEPLDLDAYPVRAVRFLEDEGYDPREVRVVTHDYVGNFLELKYGADANVFIDDRAELMPAEVARDYRVLLGGGEGWDDALERYSPDVVLWDAAEALPQLLELDDRWEQIYQDADFVVFVRA